MQKEALAEARAVPKKLIAAVHTPGSPTQIIIFRCLASPSPILPSLRSGNSRSTLWTPHPALSGWANAAITKEAPVHGGHNSRNSSDSGIAGTYVPKMSAADRLKWRAKLIGGQDPRVEIRKTTVGQDPTLKYPPTSPRRCSSSGQVGTSSCQPTRAWRSIGGPGVNLGRLLPKHGQPYCVADAVSASTACAGREQFREVSRSVL